MSKREIFRQLLYIVQWLALLSIITMIVIFSLTGWILKIPEGARNLTGNGFVETYGLRPTLLLLFLAGCAVDAILLMLSRFSRFYRYPVPVHVGNIEVQYLLAQMMYGVLECAFTIYFIFLMIEIYEMEIRMKSASFWGAILLLLGFCTLDLAIYFHLAKKNK